MELFYLELTFKIWCVGCEKFTQQFARWHFPCSTATIFGGKDSSINVFCQGFHILAMEENLKQI